MIKAYRPSVQCECKLRGLLQLRSIVSVPAVKFLGLKVFLNLAYGAASQSKYVKRAHINSKFQLDVGSFTLNFIRKLEIPN